MMQAFCRVAVRKKRAVGLALIDASLTAYSSFFFPDERL